MENSNVQPVAYSTACPLHSGLRVDPILRLLHTRSTTDFLSTNVTVKSTLDFENEGIDWKKASRFPRFLHGRYLTAIDARNLLSEPADRSDVVHHVDLVHDYFVAELSGNMYLHVLTEEC